MTEIFKGGLFRGIAYRKFMGRYMQAGDSLINTPLQRGACARGGKGNRFSGFSMDVGAPKG